MSGNRLAGNNMSNVATAQARPAVTLRPLVRSIQLKHVGHTAAVPACSGGRSWSVAQSEQASVNDPYLLLKNVAFGIHGSLQATSVPGLRRRVPRFRRQRGISFAFTLVTRRSQFHQERLIESLQPLNPAFNDFTQHLGQAAHPTGASLTAQVYQLTVQQAALLSYLDVFEAIALIFLLLLPLLLLVKPGAGAANAHAGE